MKRKGILNLVLIFLLLIVSCVSMKAENTSNTKFYTDTDLSNWDMNDTVNIPDNIFLFLDASDDPYYLVPSIEDDLFWWELNFKSVEDLDECFDYIYTDEVSGTGFFVSPEIIVTASHVIKDERNISVSNRNIKSDASLIHNDKINDIALLKVKTQNIPYFAISQKQSIKVGEEIFTLGYPLRDVLGDEIRLTKGIVNSLSGMKGDKTNIQISSEIQPGNSGGPVFNNNFSLVGMALASIDDEYMKNNYNAVAQNINFALSKDVINEEISPYTKSLNNKKAVSSIDTAIEATVLIENGGLYDDSLRRYLIFFDADLDLYDDDTLIVPYILMEIWDLDSENIDTVASVCGEFYSGKDVDLIIEFLTDKLLSEFTLSLN